MKGVHREGVASSLVNSQLFTKVGERVEGVSIIEAFLIFFVVSLNLAIVTGSIGAELFVLDVQEA